jgi:hypothetical protein
MNQSRSKKIRKIVYKDFSPRDRKYTKSEKGVIKSVGLRPSYQFAKKEYNRMHRSGNY